MKEDTLNISCKDWISVKDEMPPITVKVKLAYIVKGPGAPERQGWVSEGWLTHGLNWSIKKPSNGFYGNYEPNYWKPLKQN